MSRLALAITLSHPGYSAQLRPPFLGAAVTGATRCANCTWGHENENPPFWGMMKTHRASDAKHVGGSTPLDRTAPRQHPSAESELPADGADRSHSPAPCSWASEGQLAGESSHGRRHLGAPRGWGAGTPPAGLRGPDQVCPLQPLLGQTGLSQWSRGQRTTPLAVLGPTRLWLCLGAAAVAWSRSLWGFTRDRNFDLHCHCLYTGFACQQVRGSKCLSGSRRTAGLGDESPGGPPHDPSTEPPTCCVWQQRRPRRGLASPTAGTWLQTWAGLPLPSGAGAYLDRVRFLLAPGLLLIR